MKPTVVIAEQIAPAGIERLAQTCHVIDAIGAPREQLMGHLANAEALVVRSATEVDADMIAAGPHLKVIGRAGIGVDNIDLNAATTAGVMVVNAPTANIVSAAEHTLALLLSQARNVPAADSKLRSGVWDRQGFKGVELHGKVLGVLGLGRIGTLVSERAKAFGMTVMAFDPYVNEEVARRIGVELVSELHELLGAADFLTIHLPKTRETSGLIGKEALANVKPGIRIVNASRGGIVDEHALAEAVRAGVVAGAGLDVYETEPLTESPLFELPEVVLTPHLGASTAEAQDKAGTDVANSVVAALRGDLVPSAVNVDIGRDVPEEVRVFLPMVEGLARVFVSLAKRLPEHFTVAAEGRIGEHPTRALKLAALRGALSMVSGEPVTYVNAEPMAERHGVRVTESATAESPDWLSVVRLIGESEDELVTVSGTMARKGAMIVELQGNDVELPLSPNMLLIRNDDKPGTIGRVGMFLGDRQVNIANMVVGRSRETGQPAMMGIDIDQPLTDDDINALRQLDGVITARFVTV